MTEKQLGFELIERYCPTLIYQIEIHALYSVFFLKMNKCFTKVPHFVFSVQRKSDVR